MKIRVKDLMVGDRFMLAAYYYKVLRVDESGIYYTSAANSGTAGNSPLHLGRHSNQFVELIDRLPEVSKLTAREADH